MTTILQKMEKYINQMKDLFQTPEKIPHAVAILFNEDGEHSYEELKEIHSKCLIIGYTFEWGLDRECYDLHKL